MPWHVYQLYVGAGLAIIVGAGLAIIVGAGLAIIVGAGLGTKFRYPPITEQQNPPSLTTNGTIFSKVP
ncbi:hypothetical protein [Coleofasciculus chthonoplastes]|uniref:hypothetical protein n=1 Tax=Coleofasciculus chthonoplastes TaxID=64178 RepID=UPI0008FEC61E|nr:hypothetical protein [Coleofasciculus chthonoplastes]